MKSLFLVLHENKQLIFFRSILETNFPLVLSEISLNTIACANNSNSASLTESFLTPWSINSNFRSRKQLRLTTYYWTGL